MTTEENKALVRRFIEEVFKVIAPDLVVPIVEDDTEEAPWMVMGDAQVWAAAHLATSLHHYAQVHGRPWYVASLLPIVYRRRGEKRTRQVAPDLLVAFVPQRPRDSYDLAAEGVFPAFVLEVVSSSSVARDVDAKRRLYEALGAQEYVLFAPESGLLEPRLQGHRRGAAGRFEPWAPDAVGRLWSDVLELWLAPQGSLLRAVQADGQPLLTYEESEAARRQAEAAREQEVAARLRAEEELARLRALLEREKYGD